MSLPISETKTSHLERAASPPAIKESEELVLTSLIRRLGRGTFGTVEAWETTSGRAVALKRLYSPTSFDNEVAILSSLEKHPNIIGYYGNTLSALSIFMEFSDGQSLDSTIREKALTREQTSTIISGIANGLDHLHGYTNNSSSSKRSLFFHSDIKPPNIVLDSLFKPKIVDFGISRILVSRDPKTAETEMFKAVGGTPSYWPPEAFNTPYEVNFNADYWAFGVVCYEIFTKALPFEAKDEKHELMRIVRIKPLINNRSYGPEFQALNKQQKALITKFFHPYTSQRAVKISDIEELIP